MTAQPQKIAAMKAEADRKSEQAKAEVEAMILGEKPSAAQQQNAAGGASRRR